MCPVRATKVALTGEPFAHRYADDTPREGTEASTGVAFPLTGLVK
jgi:hypothetical protein